MMHVHIENMEYRNNTTGKNFFIYAVYYFINKMSSFISEFTLKLSGIPSSILRYNGFWVFSGRNWISLPRCSFSQSIILNRSMWKSRASGGGLFLSCLPRAETWPGRLQTSMMPQLSTPTLKIKMFVWNWFHCTQQGFLPELADLKVALSFLQKQGSARVTYVKETDAWL